MDLGDLVKSRETGSAHKVHPTDLGDLVKSCATGSVHKLHPMVLGDLVQTRETGSDVHEVHPMDPGSLVPNGAAAPQRTRTGSHTRMRRGASSKENRITGSSAPGPI